MDFAAQEANLDTFVEVFNAGDFESLQELMHPEASAPFFDALSAAAIIDGAADLVLRYPGLLATRGEVGDEPVVVLWIPAEQGYLRVGYFDFAFTDDDEPLIEHVGYSDDQYAEDLLAEEPDASEMPEGLDWRQWEEGVD